MVYEFDRTRPAKPDRQVAPGESLYLLYLNGRDIRKEPPWLSWESPTPSFRNFSLKSNQYKRAAFSTIGPSRIGGDIYASANYLSDE